MARNVLILWNECDDTPRGYLFPVADSNKKTYDKLCALQGQYVNSTAVKESDPIWTFCDRLYKGEFEKYLVKWPFTFDKSITVVVCGCLP